MLKFAKREDSLAFFRNVLAEVEYKKVANTTLLSLGNSTGFPLALTKSASAEHLLSEAEGKTL